MRTAILAALVTASVGIGAAQAQPKSTQPEPAGASSPTPSGKALFEAKCAMCHRAGGMGTGLLARRMDPAIAELEKRPNLAAGYVVVAARTGIGNMPAIPRGEVSDPQMAAIAAYLAKKGQ